MACFCFFFGAESITSAHFPHEAAQKKKKSRTWPGNEAIHGTLHKIATTDDWLQARHNDGLGGKKGKMNEYMCIYIYISCPDFVIYIYEAGHKAPIYFFAFSSKMLMKVRHESEKGKGKNTM